MDHGVSQNSVLPQNQITIENDPCHLSVTIEKTAMLVPTIQDFYIIYGTTPNYAAIRDPKKGSWIIQAFVEVLEDNYDYVDFDGLMRRVQDRLRTLSEESGVQIYQTLSCEKRGVTKKFYIAPCLLKINKFLKCSMFTYIVLVCVCGFWGSTYRSPNETYDTVNESVNDMKANLTIDDMTSTMLL